MHSPSAFLRASLATTLTLIMLLATLANPAHAQAAHPHRDHLVAALVPLIPHTEFAITARRLEEAVPAASTAPDQASSFSSKPSFHASALVDTLKSVGALSHEEHLAAVGTAHSSLHGPDASLLDSVLADHLFDSFHSPMVLVHDASDQRDYFSGPSGKLFSLGDDGYSGTEDALDAETWESMIMGLEEAGADW